VLKYVFRRLLSAIPVLIGLSVILFAFIHLLPGDPASVILGEHATPDLVAHARTNLGLDQPLYQQYFGYLGQLLRGDLGASVLTGRSVLSSFAERFPATIELAAAAMIFAVGVGIPLGRFAARHPQSWRDGGVTVASLLGVSIPVFVLGLTLQFIFAAQLNVLPAGGRIDPRISINSVTNFMLVDTVLARDPGAFIDALRHLFLPAITLGSIPLAIITRITRASVIEVSNEDYVRTARAKGLTDRHVSGRHIMRNAWLPVVTVIGLQVGSLLAGAVITESVFSWNGVGRWVVDAIKNHDYFVIQSSILLLAFMFLVVNLLVDISYAFLNPRIRYS
jgi:peptide/nickel transport system permease protein